MGILQSDTKPQPSLLAERCSAAKAEARAAVVLVLPVTFCSAPPSAEEAKRRHARWILVHAAMSRVVVASGIARAKTIESAPAASSAIASARVLFTTAAAAAEAAAVAATAWLRIAADSTRLLRSKSRLAAAAWSLVV
jgi:hypothetical protein